MGISEKISTSMICGSSDGFQYPEQVHFDDAEKMTTVLREKIHPRSASSRECHEKYGISMMSESERNHQISETEALQKGCASERKSFL